MDEYDDGYDKQAQKYILDPLTCPEPNQETGPGSSAYPIRRSLSTQPKGDSRRSKDLPTPSTSTSPSRKPSFRRTGSLFGRRSKKASSPDRKGYNQLSEDESGQERAHRPRRLLSRRNSVDSSRVTSPTTPPHSKDRKYPPSVSFNRKNTAYPINPVPTEWNQGTIFNRKLRGVSLKPVEASPPSVKGSTPPRIRSPPTPPTRSSSLRKGTSSPHKKSSSPHKGSSSTRKRSPSRRRSPSSRRSARSSRRDSPTAVKRSPAATENPVNLLQSPPQMAATLNRTADDGKGLQRASSLSARFPGDMSHRPLAMLTRDLRAADRAPYLHNKHREQPSDPIDALDHSGPVHHHDGPYEASMASRNVNKANAPLDAVRDSNMEAIKATPRAFIEDSLTKHVPLQGTATIPPGMQDMTGRTMEYQEGADLMRERDAAGGAYRRYDFIPYKDEDLKGKGEPSYTIEREHKEQKARLRKHNVSRGADGSAVYEMQPGVNQFDKNSTRVRQRSVSNAGDGTRPRFEDPLSQNDASSSHGLNRNNSTGHKFTDGLKRRFGSIRRKKSPDGPN